MTKKSCIRLTIAIVCALMLIGVSGAQAFTVLEEDGMVYKILGLEIQGQDLPFDVEFLVDTADNVYGDPPTYDFTIGEVSAAVDAVNEALNSGGLPGNSIWQYVGRQGSSDRRIVAWHWRCHSPTLCRGRRHSSID